jgi:peptide/nickel transport system ATP-binding protein
VVEAGPTAEVFVRMAHPYTRGLFAARPALGPATEAPLATIAGVVPELADLPPGCPFANRCPLMIPPCNDGLPPPLAMGAEHISRCIRARELANPA